MKKKRLHLVHVREFSPQMPKKPNKAHLPVPRGAGGAGRAPATRRVAPQRPGCASAFCLFYLSVKMCAATARTGGCRLHRRRFRI
jgi:hypothetical protein